MQLFKFINRLDQKLFFKIYACNQHSWSNNLFKVFTHSADGYLYPLFPLVFYILGEYKTAILLFWLLLIAFALERPLYFILKRSIKRNRPFNKFEGITRKTRPPDQYSFPSGHSTGSIIFALILAICFPAYCLFFYSWSACVCFSRVFLGVHYPVDVIGGVLIGATSVFIANFIYLQFVVAI